MLHAAYFIILRSMAGGYLENRPFWSQTPSHATFPAVASLFNITLTVTVQRCDVKGKHWKVLKHVVHESFLSTYLFFLATRTEFDFVYIYIYSRNQGSHFQKKNLQNSAYSSHLFQIYIILFLVHVNNLILQVSSRKAIHLFCRGSGLLALAIRTRNLTGVPFIFRVGNVFSASPGWPRRKDTKNIQ